ncbi:unnamed protein product [Protopolystoma xenopodis]|uniref:Uncharacterized protein n=1 Tax=Protopolystoma xenopodis TaxID=117903 RepID=A0A3S5CBY3_9PLAT|nr:unnamed protein product [Protopolystoma xenopodis]
MKQKTRQQYLLAGTGKLIGSAAFLFTHGLSGRLGSRPIRTSGLESASTSSVWEGGKGNASSKKPFKRVSEEVNLDLV